MYVVTYKRIKKFAIKHPQSSVALGNWYKKMKRSTPGSVTDIKKIFKNSDYIGNERFIFNICGNKYRLIAVIFLSTQIVLIRFIGTHDEYDRIDCRKI